MFYYNYRIKESRGFIAVRLQRIVTRQQTLKFGRTAWNNFVRFKKFFDDTYVRNWDE